jgi:hypothetical protein
VGRDVGVSTRSYHGGASTVSTEELERLRETELRDAPGDARDMVAAKAEVGE